MYLVNAADPMPLVLDLRITHDEEIQYQMHRVLSIDKYGNITVTIMTILLV